jgi:hypothetical protein
MTPDAVRVILLTIVVGGLAVSVLASSIRRVPANEWFVRLRRGRIDARSVRGPARVLQAPLLDRGVRVPVDRQEFALESVPIRAPDGAGLLVDVELAYRVVDPVAFVINLIPPPAGLRALVRGAAQKLLQDEPGTGTTFPGDLERGIGPIVEGRLAAAGTRDIALKVLRVRPGAVDGADEAEFQVLLRQQHLDGDVDPVEDRTLAGDIRWAIRKVGRMARWEPITVAGMTILFQLIRVPGEEPWTPSSLLFGLAFAVLLAPIVELREQIGTRHPKRGIRRTIFWILGLLVWTALLLVPIILIAAASGRL